MKLIRSITIAVIVVGGLSSPARSFAHKPIFADDNAASFTTATPIPDPEVSWAIYASLEAPSVVDHYRAARRQGGQIFARILIPKIERLRGYHPSLALVGPAMPVPSTPLPVEMPEQPGALVAEASDDEVRELEGQHLLLHVASRLESPQSGRLPEGHV